MLLEISDLRIRFQTATRSVNAVNGVSLQLSQADTLGIVGESGSGKSATALSILRLLPASTARIVAGSILLDGLDTVNLPEEELRRIRGARVGMVFQNPMSSLNPVMRIGDQITEPLLIHGAATVRAGRQRALELLEKVRIREPCATMHKYPHELSGGMRQRVMIAMALALRPRLIIADEPTTALDPTVQVEVLALLRELMEQHGSSLMLITHDLGVVEQSVRRVAVMYAGRIVEVAPTRELFAAPLHPYTAELLESLPTHWRRGQLVGRAEVAPQRLAENAAGCPFAPRCPRRTELCNREAPALLRSDPASQREVACHHVSGVRH
jgi:oligopeptide/dipeptide ABC transporter ATP-binding protein